MNRVSIYNKFAALNLIRLKNVMYYNNHVCVS